MEDEPAAVVERPLVLDELSHQFEQLRILRKGGDDEATDRLLDRLGAQDPVENEILVQLAAQRPLAHPERFVEAHGLAMRSLEVLDRNGARTPPIPRLGPLKPMAEFGVQFVTRFIVRNHQADLIDATRNLYARRLAWCTADDLNRMTLLRGRNDAERVAPGFKSDPLGVPTFLIGGAVVSVLAQLLTVAGDAAFGSRVSAGLLVFAAFAIIGFTSWCILRGAAIARHRIHLTVREPFNALWETIGRCGKPPEDDAQMFAVYAIILAIGGWLVIPAGVFFVLAAF